MGGKQASIGAVTTYPVLTAMRANVPAFAELAAYGFPSEYSLGRGRDAQNVVVQLVSGNYFRLLGVRLGTEVIATGHEHSRCE